MVAPTPATPAQQLRQRLVEVQEEIAAAAARAGRLATEVQLIAVTKTQPAAVVQAAVEAGVAAIGENYVQEAEDKFTALGWPTALNGPAPVVRHFIGHLQANKIRKALTWFDLIHTVDSLALAERIDRVAAELGRVVPVLLQVNISSEATKSGISPSEVEGVFPFLAKLTHITVNGLMTIGRFTPDEALARQEFRQLRALRDALRAVAPPTVSLEELSMGMSHDFAVAVEEGATMVRVGSRLFGARG